MEKILVAEDEASMRGLYQTYLSQDYNASDVKLVATGDEAIRVLEEMLSRGEKPALVITDNQMPPGEKTGMDVIDYVKANLSDTPVVMIAGENLEKTVRKNAVQKGASAYLPKPVGMNAFLEVVKKYVK